MKYLIIVLLIFSAATLATLVTLWPEKQPVTDDIVVTINGRTLSRQSIRAFQDKTPHDADKKDLINEIIIQQLLIEEAQRLNIDQEPGFRKALKTYYEHSLIKILLDRISKESKAVVSDEEIDIYLNSFGKTFTFYSIKASGDLSTKLITQKGEKRASLFDDLSKPLQHTLSVMRPGDIATTFLTGNEKIAIYLEKVEGSPRSGQKIDRAKIRQQLLQTKTENFINNWINNLRNQASVTFQTSQE